MAIKDYILPINSGAQMWQMLWSNTTRGSHPYNFSGLCATMVAQWLMEIKFAAGASPEEFGRHLLQADLGPHGYGGLASSQAIYGRHAPRQNNHSALFDRHSGSSLTRGDQSETQTANGHWTLIRNAIYNGGGPQLMSGHIGITGDNYWLLRPVFGNTWGHAIGLHCDTNRTYFFDPNYGVAIIDAADRITTNNFVTDVWTEYGVTVGRYADVT
jgi:hypothetical protein